MFSDPRLFNYVLVALFTLAAVRWAAAGCWADSAYNLFAAGIQAVITWGYER